MSINKGERGLRFYLICKADAWYSFLDIGRRCETPGSEIEDSLTFTTLTIVKVSSFCISVCLPIPRVPNLGDSKQLHCKTEILSFGNLRLLLLGLNMPLQCSQKTCSFALEGNIIYIFHCIDVHSHSLSRCLSCSRTR